MNNISFPGLGISLDISPVAFSIGAKPIYWYAIIILAGFLAGLLFVAKDSKKYGLPSENVWDIAIIGLLSGIVCARIYYVLFALDEFESFWDIFKIWNGGLAIYGGLIGGIASAAVYCKIKKLDFLNACDVCCCGIFIGQAIGRWGNFVNTEVYGGPTSLPWGMSVNGAPPVHPLFLYESVWNLIGLVIYCILRPKKKANGQLICFYIGWYSLGRLFLEGMRNPEYILYAVPGAVGISQIVAAIGIIIAVAGFIVVSRAERKKAHNNA